MASDRVSNNFRVLEDTLWNERNLLEHLLFKLVVANLIFASDDAELIELALQDVDQVVRRIRVAEEYRDRVMTWVSDEVGVPASELSLEYPGVAGGSDIFPTLDELAFTLETRDTAGIDAAIADVEASLDRTLDGLARLSAAANRIKEALGRNAGDALALQAQLSRVEDVDFAEAVMDLQVQEIAYEAALTAFAASRQASLVDFLH